MTTPDTNAMADVNGYGRELTPQEIDRKAHRHFVGGLWDELGKLQFDFLVGRGLKPAHKLLDIGCGCLRGGLYYIDNLDTGNYYGLDINSSLIQAGLAEVRNARLEDKYPTLLVDDNFRLERFSEAFDFMVSVSLFTHLPANIIVRCLVEAKKYLKPGGVYFSTFFQAPHSAYLGRLTQLPINITTNYDSDPFHYSFEELSHMADVAELEAELIGEWNHPRNQKMIAFSRKESV